MIFENHKATFYLKNVSILFFKKNYILLFCTPKLQQLFMVHYTSKLKLFKGILVPLLNLLTHHRTTGQHWETNEKSSQLKTPWVDKTRKVSELSFRAQKCITPYADNTALQGLCQQIWEVSRNALPRVTAKDIISIKLWLKSQWVSGKCKNIFAQGYSCRIGSVIRLLLCYR